MINENCTFSLRTRALKDSSSVETTNSILLLTCLSCVSYANEGFVENRERKAETNRTNEMTMNVKCFHLESKQLGLSRDEAFETLIDCSCLNLSLIVIDAFSFRNSISSRHFFTVVSCAHKRESLTFHHLLSTSTASKIFQEL